MYFLIQLHIYIYIYLFSNTWIIEAIYIASWDYLIFELSLGRFIHISIIFASLTYILKVFFKNPYVVIEIQK